MEYTSPLMYHRFKSEKGKNKNQNTYYFTFIRIPHNTPVWNYGIR